MNAVNYLFPDTQDPSGLMIFQDVTSQIRGFGFKKSRVSDIKKLEFAENAGIYFLLSETTDDNLFKTIYIGQSVNGISRVEMHVKGKSFWQRGFLFVTDNASFSATSIDYIEYLFIQHFRGDKSDYLLDNSALRENEPNVTTFEKPALISFFEKIVFLLSCQGIQANTKEKESKVTKNKAYTAGRNYNASLVVEDGEFILLAGSHIRYPRESVKNWSDKKVFGRRKKQIDELLENGKAIKDGDLLVTIVNINFTSPSTPAVIVSGLSKNGWFFWQGLDELRK